MNAYQRAAVWVRLMVAALQTLSHDEHSHLADRASRAAKLADFALAEYIARHEKPKGGA